MSRGIILLCACALVFEIVSAMPAPPNNRKKEQTIVQREAILIRRVQRPMYPYSLFPILKYGITRPESGESNESFHHRHNLYYARAKIEKR